MSTTETVRAQIRSADEVATELGDGPIDLLKLDVEGSEVQVLESLGSARLAQVQVLYVEYDNRFARRRIEDLVRDSHELFYASMLALDQGEMVYVASHLVDRPGANDALIEILRPQFS